MRTRTEDITLNTWTVRVDGQDVTDVELDEGQAGNVRQMVADATGGRVSLGLTANMRGMLLQLLGIA